MKKIYVMRHAKAVHNSKIDDHERPLHEMGVDACRNISDYLEKQQFIPEIILCSTSSRTKETANILQESVYAKVPLTLLPSLYQASNAEILYEIKKLKDSTSSVLIIGHNPGVYDFCLMMAGSGDYAVFQRLQEGFPPASFVAISFVETEWVKLEPRVGRLEAVHVP